MDRRGWINRLVAATPWAVVLSAALLAGCAGRGDLAQADVPAAGSEEADARRRAQIRMELAVSYFEQGQTNIALEELRQVLASDPNFSDAYNLRGLIYMRMNEPRQAEESFRRAASLNPRDGNTLHNLGWLQCQERRYDESQRSFDQALAISGYLEKARTLMAQGVCHAFAGKRDQAEKSLFRAYELDPGNPIISYDLASLLYDRGDLERAQFHLRRLNNSQLANAETLWLGMKVERKLGDRLATGQLGDQLRRRFPQSRQAQAYDRGAFDE